MPRTEADRRREYARGYQRRRVSARLAAGLCVDCGNPPREGKQTCQPCGDKRIDYQREYRQTNPEAYRASGRKTDLRRLFGITPADYDAMLGKQGGRCKICGGANANGNALAVDHCHKTGRVRGLLCHLCNTAIGKLGDTPEGLRRALEYLEAA